MTFVEFAAEMKPVVEYFGAQNFPRIVVERIHYKCQDLSREQVRELLNLILDSCEFAPKVPRIVELAGIIRGRHRQAVPLVSNDGEPRTPEVARKGFEELHRVLAQIKTTSKPEGSHEQEA